MMQTPALLPLPSPKSERKDDEDLLSSDWHLEVAKDELLEFVLESMSKEEEMASWAHCQAKCTLQISFKLPPVHRSTLWMAGKRARLGLDAHRWLELNLKDVRRDVVKLRCRVDVSGRDGRKWFCVIERRLARENADTHATGFIPG